MDLVSFKSGLKAAIAMSFILFSVTVANAQTVVFKQPPPQTQFCALDTKVLEAKIAELKDVNAQLAAKAKKLETQVFGLKVANTSKPKKTQVCKRWSKHRCTWLVWK